MICCKECLDLLYDYMEGDLDPKSSTKLDEHFSDCPPCIAFLNTYKSTTSLSRQTLGKIEMPEAVQRKLLEFIKGNTQEKN
ncbi:MAG: zf-HC2 domain-containing protein [Nitrospinota bacterium]|nr:zf-HC2 domain-containing protein [Nitrospinota bacterium]